MRTNDKPKLVDAFFGAYRRRVLAIPLLRPDETFYVREWNG